MRQSYRWLSLSGIDDLRIELCQDETGGFSAEAEAEFGGF